MALRLIVDITGDSVSNFIYTFDQDSVTLGRSLICDIQLPFPTISNHHLTFLKQEKGYALRDEGSTNGVRVGDTVLVQGAQHPVRSGDQIHLMGVTIHLQVMEEEDISLTSTARTGELARQMITAWTHSEGDTAQDMASLEVLEGLDQGLRHNLPMEGAFTFGGQGQWILQDPTLRDTTLTLTLGREGYALAILDQPAILLDGQTQTPGTKALLRSGHRLRIGATTFLFFDPLQSHLDALEQHKEQDPPTPASNKPTPDPAQTTPQEPTPPPKKSSSLSAMDFFLGALALLFALGALVALAFLLKG